MDQKHKPHNTKTPKQRTQQNGAANTKKGSHSDKEVGQSSARVFCHWPFQHLLQGPLHCDWHQSQLILMIQPCTVCATYSASDVLLPLAFSVYFRDHFTATGTSLMWQLTLMIQPCTVCATYSASDVLSQAWHKTNKINN